MLPSRICRSTLMLLACLLALAAAPPAAEAAGAAAEEPPAAEAAPGAAATQAAEPPAPPSASGKVMVIDVKGAIIADDWRLKALVDGPVVFDDKVVGAIDQAEREGARLVVLEINSPGGVVDSCDRIAQALIECPLPTVALVTRDAVSGGAMVATACDEIVMAEGGRIGDVEPHALNMKLPDYMREKIETAIRARLRANAQANGYPPKVLEAMVSKSIELYRITYADGSAEYLKAGELELLEKQIADGEIEREIADREIVAAEGRLLTLTAHEAVEHGLSKEVLTTPEDFYLEREITLADRVEPSVEVTVEEPQEKMSLGWTIILIFCLVIGVAGVVVEANVPGFGVPGVIGICGFAAFFAILALRFARADDWEIALFVIGLVLILVELFVIPGFGVAGILGVVAVLASIVLAFLPDFDSELMEVDFTGQLEFMIQVMGAASFASILVGWLLVKFVNRIPLVRRAVLATHLKSGSEVWASVAEEEAGRYPHEAEQRKTHQESALKGKEGVATTVLRPSGKIRLEDGRTLDVVSDGGMVPEGSRVRVHEVNGPRITVMPVPEE